MLGVTPGYGLLIGVLIDMGLCCVPCVFRGRLGRIVVNLHPSVLVHFAFGVN